MREYNVYDITPPSLLILTDGPYIYMGGFNEEDRSKIKNIFESAIYDSEIAFHYITETITDETVAWLDTVFIRINFVIMNIDNITAIEQYLIDKRLTAEEEDDTMVVYYSETGLNHPMARLLSSEGEVVINNLKEVELILKEMMESK